jgi:hypothetical protein
MNKIFRKAYPVDRLPSDLQAALSTYQLVDIEFRPSASSTLRPVAALVGSGRNVHGDEAAIIKHVRNLRKD